MFNIGTLTAVKICPIFARVGSEFCQAQHLRFFNLELNCEVKRTKNKQKEAGINLYSKEVFTNHLIFFQSNLRVLLLEIASRHHGLNMFTLSVNKRNYFIVLYSKNCLTRKIEFEVMAECAK